MTDKLGALPLRGRATHERSRVSPSPPSVSVPNAREIALSWIDEYERETIAERRAQYGAQFTADQQAAIEQTHRHLRAGVNIMADAIAMEARQRRDAEERPDPKDDSAGRLRHRPDTPSLQTPQGGDS